MDLPFLPISARKLCVFVFAVGCSGTSSDSLSAADASTASGDVPCTITWSGAVSATESCVSLSDSSYVASSNTSDVALSFTPPAGAPDVASLNIAIYFSGRPTPGAVVRSTDDGARGSASVSQSGNPWLVEVGPGTTNLGSYTLTISAVHEIGAEADGTAYTVHGTFDATLPARPNTSATGTVEISVAF